MKLSCLPVSLYPDLAAGQLSLPGWFQLARSLGLDGADLSVAHIQHRAGGYLDELRTAAEAAGVTVAMLATYTDFTHPSAAERLRQRDDLRGWIEAAARLATPFLRVTAGQAHPGVSESDGLAWASEGLTSCLAEARAGGVTLLYENHVRGAVWSANDFTQPAGRFLEVARRTAGSGLGILFDTANNLALGDNPLTVLEAVKERVGALHLSDITEVGTFHPTVIGTGVAPIPQVLQTMVAAGFDGWISIEEASRTGLDAFRTAIAYTDSTWHAAGGDKRDH